MELAKGRTANGRFVFVSSNVALLGQFRRFVQGSIQNVPGSGPQTCYTILKIF